MAISITRQDADSLSKKMMRFREGLNDKEKVALDGLLFSVSAAAQAKKPAPTGTGLVAPSGTKEVISEIKIMEKRFKVEPLAATPALTITTTITIAASHPWITCAQAINVAQAKLVEP